MSEKLRVKAMPLLRMSNLFSVIGKTAVKYTSCICSMIRQNPYFFMAVCGQFLFHCYAILIVLIFNCDLLCYFLIKTVLAIFYFSL